MDLPQQDWIENKVHDRKTYWLISKEKVLGTVISKEGPTDSVVLHKSIDFLEKGAIGNNASYCQQFL